MKSLEKQFSQFCVQNPPTLEVFRRKSFQSFLDKGGFERKDFDFWRTQKFPKTKFFFRPPEERNTPVLKKTIPSSKFYIVFLEGKFQENLSNLPQKVVIRPLKEDEQKELLNQEDKRLYLFNDSFFEPGVVIEFLAQQKIKEPIFIHHLTQNTSSELLQVVVKNKIILQEEAEAAFVEIFENKNTFMNRSHTIFLGKRSRLDYLQIQNSEPECIHTDINFIELSEESYLDFFSLSHGSSFARHEIDVKIKGKKVEAFVRGLYKSSQKQYIDHQVTMDHIEGESKSYQNFKGLLYGQSHSVFRTLSRICKKAQETDSFQMNKNLIFSPQAKADSQPVLEVYADNVKAQHGSTIGALSPQDMFYLMSRGLKQEKAKELLTEAFVRELFSQVGHKDLRDTLFQEHQKQNFLSEERVPS